MLPPLIQRRRSARNRPGERGVTLALVALAIFSIIAMAGLSIDIGTLYQASAEAQRSADAAALAAARVLSLSGMTGDPNSSARWSAACTLATQTAQTVAGQNFVGGSAPTASVTFLSSDSSNCTTLGAFGVNPMVTVKVSQSSLPTYFARIWGRSGNSVSATATAEAFNPSNSGAYSSSADVVPAQPRCVKPLMIPNRDPLHALGCTTGCLTFVGPLTGTSPSSITTAGILISGAGSGVIGESFYLVPDCGTTGPPCAISTTYTAPQGNVGTASTPNLQYLPGQVLGTRVAVPSCTAGGSAESINYQEAVAGCDQSTPYQCGVLNSIATNPSYVDLNENPYGPAGDMFTAVQCLTNPSSKGADTLNTGVYPYQILAGAGNPLKVSGSVITTSNSIVSLPIFDDTATFTINGSNQAPVTIVGFLQVFINSLDANGNPNVTVLNVAGCGNSSTSASPFVTGTSPVPVRLITPPSS